MRRITCEMFEADAAELSVGTIDEPHRTDLLEHASTCPSCREVLDEVTDLADRLLLLAPEAEPPAGFESRALASLPRPSPPAPRASRARIMGAAVAAVLAFVVGVVVGNAGRTDAPVRSAVVVSPALTSAGSVELAGAELTVSLGQDLPWPDEVACELIGPDGAWTRVASWSPDPRYGGEWTVTVDESLTRSPEMRLVSGDGAVLGRAFFGVEQRP